MTPNERERRTRAAAEAIEEAAVRWLGGTHRTPLDRDDVAQAALDAADEAVPVISEAAMRRRLRIDHGAPTTPSERMISIDAVSIHELMQRTDAAVLLDRATRRLAAAIDVTDTDEGLERVQTELVAAILDAVKGVIDKENRRRLT